MAKPESWSLVAGVQLTGFFGVFVNLDRAGSSVQTSREARGSNRWYFGDHAIQARRYDIDHRESSDFLASVLSEGGKNRIAEWK